MLNLVTVGSVKFDASQLDKHVMLLDQVPGYRD